MLSQLIFGKTFQSKKKHGICQTFIASIANSVFQSFIAE